MKKLNKVSNNCIPTPSSCVDMGIDIPSLGICYGDPLDKVVLEIADKLENIAGEDISKFDIDTLLSICNEKAPLEVNLISILTLIKDNQICLKDYIEVLKDEITELSGKDKVTVNLKCYADIDNLGNVLSITRPELDQLVINQLCNHKTRIETVEGKITSMQNEINSIDLHPQVEEPNFSTCITPTLLPTSGQTKAISEVVCDMRNSIGLPAQVAGALSKVPSDWNTKFGLIQGWDLTPDNWAQQYGNLLLAFSNLMSRVEYMEQNCCAIDCESVKVGFFVTTNEDGNGIILTFSSSAGTKIPSGFTDKGSTGTITDINGNTISFNMEIKNGYEIEIPITGLSTSGMLDISLNTKIGSPNLLCDKCLGKKIELKGGCCVITNIATTDTVIIYESTI